uniref:Uncharacterized protein n=1 Tax=Manihot esculenta TaxID=3983 RepID=A0A2C9UZV2_MANES
MMEGWHPHKAFSFIHQGHRLWSPPPYLWRWRLDLIVEVYHSLSQASSGSPPPSRPACVFIFDPRFDLLP